MLPHCELCIAAEGIKADADYFVLKMRPPLDDDDVDYIDEISDREIGLPKRRSWPLAG
jgi:hypothetical protein